MKSNLPLNAVNYCRQLRVFKQQGPSRALYSGSSSMERGRGAELNAIFVSQTGSFPSQSVQGTNSIEIIEFCWLSTK